MTNPWQLRAVVFDLDGTLLDTLEHVARAFERVTAEYGEPASREQIIAAIGPPLADCYRLLLPAHDASVAADKHHAFQQTDEFMQLITEYAGLRDMLRALHDKGIRAAIFTNRWRRGVDLIFSKLDLAREFDVIITPEDVRAGKPDPEGMHIIAGKLDLPESSLMMVGDLPVDIAVGKNAGVGYTVGITHGFGTRESLAAAGADYVIDSLAQFSELVERLS